MQQDNATMKTSKNNEQIDGINITTFEKEGTKELFLTVGNNSGKTPQEVFAKAARLLLERGAAIVSQEVFGLQADDLDSAIDAMRKAGHAAGWPVTACEEDDQKLMYGTHIWALSATDVDTISIAGRTIGAVFEDESGRYCRLGGIGPDDISATPPNQTQAVFDRFESILKDAGMDFSHVIRTWFYNRDILAWYGEFNQVRTQFFNERNVFAGILPASTGIGGRNPSGAALVGGLLAYKANQIKQLDASTLDSPLQGEAYDYGSSFSRAVEIETAGLKRVLVSGTASIAPDGETLHLDDTAGQIDKTMEVVHAILQDRGMNWEDVVRATAYIKNADEANLFNDYVQQKHIEDMPTVLVQNTVCRGNLLFEVELDGVKISEN